MKKIDVGRFGADSVPADSEFVHSLGRAVFNFAHLEWQVNWLGEQIQPGFLAQCKDLTAGQMAGEFKTVAAKIPTTEDDQNAITALAASFADIVQDRNRLVHGSPAMLMPDEKTAILYVGKNGFAEWTSERVAEFSEQVAKLIASAHNIQADGRLAAYVASKMATQTTGNHDRT